MANDLETEMNEILGRLKILSDKFLELASQKPNAHQGVRWPEEGERVYVVQLSLEIHAVDYKAEEHQHLFGWGRVFRSKEQAVLLRTEEVARLEIIKGLRRYGGGAGEYTFDVIPGGTIRLIKESNVLTWLRFPTFESASGFLQDYEDKMRVFFKLPKL